MKLGFIDHYDSFSFNVLDWLREPGIDLLYAAYDDPGAMERLVAARCPLVLSPGPGRPEDVPPSLDLVRKALGTVPIFGICLGHQILAHLAGATVRRSAAPFHGSVRPIHVTNHESVLRNVPATFHAAVYHSLVADDTTLPQDWKILARDSLGEVQAIAWTPPHREAAACGIQFHPESFMSEASDQILAAWLQMVQDYYVKP